MVPNRCRRRMLRGRASRGPHRGVSVSQCLFQSTRAERCPSFGVREADAASWRLRAKAGLAKVLPLLADDTRARELHKLPSPRFIAFLTKRWSVLISGRSARHAPLIRLQAVPIPGWQARKVRNAKSCL